MGQLAIKYKTRSQSTDSERVTTSITFQGSREEMYALADEYPIKSVYFDAVSQIEGNVKSSRIYQDEGPIWCCELQISSNCHGNYIDPPDVSYGKKSATLECGLLSLPLEVHPKYRTNWNYYLAGNGTSTIPAWWETATDTNLTDRRYRWVSSPDEISGSPTWRILKKPEKLGYSSYDLATYVIRESVRCRSASAAGKICANKMNRIIDPENDFGIKGGNWKCDGVSVRWNGTYWLASMIYTRSGDEEGWDKDLYGEKVK